MYSQTRKGKETTPHQIDYHAILRRTDNVQSIYPFVTDRNLYLQNLFSHTFSLSFVNFFYRLKCCSPSEKSNEITFKILIWTQDPGIKFEQTTLNSLSECTKIYILPEIAERHYWNQSFKMLSWIFVKLYSVCCRFDELNLSSKEKTINFDL